MIIREETVVELKCAFADHFVIDPLTLANCGQSISKIKCPSRYREKSNSKFVD